MKTALGWLGLVTMGMFFALGTSGCEAACTEDEETGGTTCTGKSLTRFKGQDGNDSAAWTSGGDVTVDGVFGNILVVADSQDSNVNVTFKPFSYRAHDAQVEAERDMNEALKTDASEAGSGVLVKSWREGTHGSSLGAQMIVHLPTNFDGKLIVINHGDGDVSTDNDFDVKLASVGGATALEVRTGSDIGACNIYGAPSVTQSDVHCGSNVWLRDVSDTVNVSTTFGAVIDEAIFIDLASISAGSGGTITSEDGDINMVLPAGSAFSIQAQSSAKGIVEILDNPAECTVETAAETAKTLSCSSGGPNYTVTAGIDSLGDSNVKLQF